MILGQIVEFSGQHRFLSNFYPSDIVYDGIRYPTVEHAYQAQKTTSISDRTKIAALPTAAEAKKFGKSVKIRSDWEQVKINIMRDLLAIKFTIPDLRDRLVDTGDYVLIEGNYWNDTFWGICRGVGENWLGRLLMEARADIQK